MQLHRKIKKNIDDHGISIIHVDKGVDTPAFSYTIGLTGLLSHSEVIIYGLPPESAGPILNAIYALIKSNGAIEDGIVLNQIANFPLVAKELNYELGSQIAIKCEEYYRDDYTLIPRYLIIYWPDEKGMFPWNPNFNKKLANIQPQFFSS